MPTHKIQWLSVLIAAATQSSFAAGELAHPRIDKRTSFLFSETVEDHKGKHGPYWPRLDAWARNNKGGVIFTIASGPKKELPKNAILQTTFALAAGACVVDVFSGFALVNGRGCELPLPTDRAWAATDRSNDTYQCRLTQPHVEHVSVPAGEFAATKIECREVVAAQSKQQVTSYWYVPSLGAMVKTVYHNFDADRAETSTITLELANYEAPPQKGSD